ncbi:MAG: WhiB family transcriptional regulator [Ferrimicrobium sp.]
MASEMSQEAAGESDWHMLASCRGRDPRVFFPERGATGTSARAICLSCLVREQCLDYAIRNDERFGIWGGFSERERRRIRFLRMTHPWAELPGE